MELFVAKDLKAKCLKNHQVGFIGIQILFEIHFKSELLFFSRHAFFDRMFWRLNHEENQGLIT